MKIKLSTLRTVIREAAMSETQKGWGANPSRSTDQGKFVVGCGKNKARAEAVASQMVPELQRLSDARDQARDKGDSSHYWMQALWNPPSENLRFFVAQDPYKHEWSVYMSLDPHPGLSRDDWQVIFNTGANLKRKTGSR